MSTVETIKNLFVDLGASWVLWLLFALSAGSAAMRSSACCTCSQGR